MTLPSAEYALNVGSWSASVESLSASTAGSLQLQLVLLGLDELDDPLRRIGHEGFELLDRRVQPPGFELRQHVLGDLPARRAARMVRILGDELHVLAEVLRLGDGPEPLLGLALRRRVSGREAAQAAGRLRPDRGRAEKKDDDDEDSGRETVHGRHYNGG